MAIIFSWLKDNELFSRAIRKMSLNISLDEEEMQFSLSCAILFLKEYDGDKRKSPYFEFSYFIVLKCALNNDFYEPLLDVTSNFGLYPISQYIIKNELIKPYISSQFILEYQLKRFEYNSITETYEQKKYRQQMLESDKKENCYIAPTSFGKSSLIVDIIKFKQAMNVAIIVPTKSLLIQTYRLIKINFPNEKVIFHDEMYDGSDNFISVFTQERALRLLKNKNISFDIMIVDEAHNIFEMDGRSILLTRLIRRNRFRNPKSTNYYLSPLISESGNLKVASSQEIFERKIINNIKEPDIHEFRDGGEVYKYNRFLNEFYLLGKELNFIDYIVNNKKKKNFLYLRSPKKVEAISLILNRNLPSPESKELLELSEVVSRNVHNDFYCVDYIKNGLIYLHGKLPDLIKEYLEYKFSKVRELEYMVANSVILEGVNLPVDNLFILNTYNMDQKSLTNLIGRVNRLNEVFDDKNGSLNKLSPSVHFVNSDEFNRKGGKMENKIRLLKSGTFKDVLKNPLLINFDLDKFIRDIKNKNSEWDENDVSKPEDKINLITSIREREEFLIYEENNDSNKVKRLFAEAGISSIYENPDIVFKELEERIGSMHRSNEWSNADVIEKIYLFFIKGMDSHISNAEFFRLQHPKARAFYKMFTENLHRLSLKDHISHMVGYFNLIKNKDSGRRFYIGASYGEIARTETDSGYSKNVFLDLSQKTNKELVNIALVKIKIESDFVSFTLNEHVNILFELGLISENEYDLHIYGTINKSNSEYVKLGLSGSLINALDRDGQLKNLSINNFGAIECNDDFLNYIAEQDDLIRFEIGKYIDIN